MQTYLPYALLAAILLLPLILGIKFKTAANHIFLSLLAGELLVRYFGDDATLVVRPFIRSEEALKYVELAILVVPIVLTAVFLKGTLGKGKLVLQFFPLLVTGLVFAAFALPLLPTSGQSLLRSTESGEWLHDSTDFIVGVMVFFQLIVLWLTQRKPKEEKGKHH